ncbi:MAG: PEP-CTERM sorting domain-containing protein [Phycisphaerae bacterium]|nr:PEP-CTERM sorting domain-containing protein [Phycisphaerae bacterium]
MMKRLLVMVALLMAVGTAYAANYDFAGGVAGNDWNDANNWVTLTSIYDARSTGTTAGAPPTGSDRVVIRDNVTATLSGEGYMGLVGAGIYNGVGAVEYLDTDLVTLLWAEPAKLVMESGAFLHTLVVKNTGNAWVVGGVYGGEMEVKGGSLSPDYYLYIGKGGNYTYKDRSGITPVGKLTLSAGGTLVPYFDGVNGTKTRIKVGYAGGNGTLIIDGADLPRWKNATGINQAGVQLYVGEGTAGDATNDATWGYFEFKGGSLNSDENFAFGSNAGKAKLIVSGGSLLSGGDVYIGWGNNHNNVDYADAGSLSYGDGTVSGNAVWICDRLGIGHQNGRGTLTIKDTATFRYNMAVTGNSNENSIGRSVVMGTVPATNVAGNGVGVVNVEGGTFQYMPTASNTTRGTVRLGWTWDNRAATTKDPTFVLDVFSRGEINQTGGVVLFEAHGTTKSAVTPSDQYLVLGSSYLNQAKNNATGIIDVSGGVFKTVGKEVRVYTDPNDEETYLTTVVVKTHMILAQNKDTTGIVKIGRNASFSVDGNFTMAPGAETGASAKLVLDFGNPSNARLDVTGVATLAQTLELNSVGGYRPKENDTMVVIRSTDPNAVYYSGDFSTIITNITRGSQGQPFFAGSKSAGDYIATFRGLTYGDANGDHKVDGSDLALMGGSWMKTGQTWATCEFSGDPNGLVDGSDLALMGGNWMWPPAPGPGAALPEPATLALLGLGGLAVIRRKR